MLAKKPKSPPTKESKAQNFIAAAGGRGRPAGAVNGNQRGELKTIGINFPLPLLARLDTASVNMGLTRTAFILMAVNERLARAERGE